MNVLIVTRKGDVQEVMASTDVKKLQAHAQAQESTPIQWNNFYGEVGANSNDDEEKSYGIHKAQVIL